MSDRALWTLREAASRMRLSPRAARRRLRELHARHGGLLYRAEGGRGRNTKLWVEPERLLALVPSLARREDLGDVLTRLDKVEEEVAAFRRKAHSWLTRGPK